MIAEVVEPLHQCITDLVETLVDVLQPFGCDRLDPDERTLAVGETLRLDVVVRDEAGALLIQAREQVDGAVAVTDAAGATMAMHSPEAVAQARQLLLNDGAEGLAPSSVPSEALKAAGTSSRNTPSGSVSLPVL